MVSLVKYCQLNGQPSVSRALCFSFFFCVFVGNTCLHLWSDCPAGLQSPAPEFIVDVESMDIFPVGWCEANSYPLTTPHKTVCEYRLARSPGVNIWGLVNKEAVL